MAPGSRTVGFLIAVTAILPLVERHVKERLVGAAVLIAAAVILIPEMLSGPKRPAAPSAPARAGEAPMKTYTIDLNHSPDAPAATTGPKIEEPAPPPELVQRELAKEPPTPEPAAQSATDDTTPRETAAEKVVRADDVSKPPERVPPTIPESAPPKKVAVPAPEPPRPVVTQEPERPAPIAQPVPKPLATSATAPTSRQWAVQLGSFSSKPTAERVAQEWEGRGSKAFVMPVKAGTGMMYRVRLGPFAERSAADEALRKTGGKAPGAAVVAHP